MTDKITIEVGTGRSLPLIGRDTAGAARDAAKHGTVTRVTRDGAEVAALVPSGPGEPMSPRDLCAAVSALLSRHRGVFDAQARVSDADVLGLLVGQFLDGSRRDILTVAATAAEDGNHHELAAQLLALRGRAAS
jgi:hypothetical protein